MSGALSSRFGCARPISSTNRTKSKPSDRVDDRTGGHRAIGAEVGVVSPDRGAGRLELAPEVAVVVTVEEVDDDRDRVARGDDGGLASQTSERGELRAQLLLPRAHANPLDLRQRGDRRERGDREAGLVMIVVGAEQLHVEPGQRPLERLVERDAQQEKAVHVLATVAGAQAMGAGGKSRVEPEGRRETARREAEPASRVGPLPPGIGVIAGRGSLLRSHDLRRASPRLDRHGDALLGRSNVGRGRGLVGTTFRDCALVLRSRLRSPAGQAGLGHGLIRARGRAPQHVPRDLGEHAAVVLRHGASFPGSDRTHESSADDEGDHRRNSCGQPLAEPRYAALSPGICREHGLRPPWCFELIGLLRYDPTQ